MLDWQRTALPVLKATYDRMDELGETMLDGDEIVPRLVTPDRDRDALLQIFMLINRTGHADVQFVSGGVAFIVPTDLRRTAAHAVATPRQRRGLPGG